MSLGRVVGVDLGTKRVGVAISDAGRVLASPYEVIARSGDVERDRRRLRDIVEEVEAAAIGGDALGADRLGLRQTVLDRPPQLARVGPGGQQVLGRGLEPEDLVGAGGGSGKGGHLGGPESEAKLVERQRKYERIGETGTGRMFKVVDEASGEPAGSVGYWEKDWRDTIVWETGWSVLPEFQGQGVGKRAVRAVLELARDEDRWGMVHAFPAVTNTPSNALCRSVGFRLAGEVETLFAGRTFRTNHWFIDPRTDLG